MFFYNFNRLKILKKYKSNLYITNRNNDNSNKSNKDNIKNIDLIKILTLKIH